MKKKGDSIHKSCFTTYFSISVVYYVCVCVSHTRMNMEASLTKLIIGDAIVQYFGRGKIYNSVFYSNSDIVFRDKLYN